MEKLKSQINVLREIVHYCLPAHIAFLSHEAYRNLYYTIHGQAQLADEVIGWKIFQNGCRYNTYVMFNSTKYNHPICPNFVYNRTLKTLILDFGCHFMQFYIGYDAPDDRILELYMNNICRHYTSTMFDADVCDDIMKVYNHIVKHKIVPNNFIELTYDLFFNQFQTDNPQLHKAFPQ